MILGSKHVAAILNVLI